MMTASSTASATMTASASASPTATGSATGSASPTATATASPTATALARTGGPISVNGLVGVMAAVLLLGGGVMSFAFSRKS